ncbi:response regulator transcription factor [Kamptonema cortianum]|nr:response regulator transcription factor [Oscillatoria laete-virens]MDK3161841.1 response regulator transcription factor [Kamptonema cortianum]MDL5054411.1 response regulator transcription factor [Oscillatoria laete-virens NRMC-F 0139]
MKTKVLIVDDHSIVRFGIRSLLGHNPEIQVCGEAENADNALRIFKKEKPQMALVDISIDGNGLELTKEMLRINSDVKIIIISMHDETIYADRALKAGAKGYLMKRDASSQLMKVIDTVLKGGIYLSESMTRSFLSRIAGGTTADSTAPEHVLSDRELEIFGMIGQGHQTKEISTKLRVSSKTIETHRERIKEKLGIHDARELRKTAVLWAKDRIQ